jgi:uncharacterized LabA/DUF88 family protein
MGSMVAGFGGAQQKVSTYAFIDLAAVLFGIERTSKRLEMPGLKLVPATLVSENDRTFVYDALPVPKTEVPTPEEMQSLKARKALHDEFRKCTGAHVLNGETRRAKGEGMRQKGVDILMALDVFQHAIIGNMDVAKIYVSDLDFLPLLEALVRTRVKTRLYCDPYKSPVELRHAADQSEIITARDYLRYCAVPDDGSLLVQIAQTDHPGVTEFDYPEVEHGKIGDRAVEVWKGRGLPYRSLCPELQLRFACLERKLAIAMMEDTLGGQFVPDAPST